MSKDWISRAACRDAEDPELFFPISETPASYVQIYEAKTVCAGCPVRGDCLRYAMEEGLSYGIYGGTTASERLAAARGDRDVTPLFM